MIVFAWDGFPQYGARCVAALVEAMPKERIVVFATRPSVPVTGMDELARCPVYWHDGSMEDLKRRIKESGIDLAEVEGLFVSGWNLPYVCWFRDEVGRLGAAVFAMCDVNYLTWRAGIKAWCRQILQMVRFRILIKRHYQGMFVPGRSGVRLMRFWGWPEERISTGLYAADDALFTDGVPLPQRPRRMLFIGRLIPRKNILPFCRTFIAAGAPEQGWTLDVYGSGEQKAELCQLAATCPAIAIHDFVQPEKIAALYREARVFVLPSLEEHWGLVVHEAALSGCIQLLSEGIGAAEDFITERNGVAFNPRSEVDIKRAIQHVMALSDDELRTAQRESLRLASENGGKNHFVDGVRKLLLQTRKEQRL